MSGSEEMTKQAFTGDEQKHDSTPEEGVLETPAVAEGIAGPVQLVFRQDEYAVDTNKMLYKRTEKQLEPLCQMKRHVYAIAKMEERVYILDKAGDCYELAAALRFVCGVLSSPLFFAVSNQRVIIQDAYKRVWVFRTTGTIETIYFTEKRVAEAVWTDKLEVRVE